jgi:hypothetical protein
VENSLRHSCPVRHHGGIEPPSEGPGLEKRSLPEGVARLKPGRDLSQKRLQKSSRLAFKDKAGEPTLENRAGIDVDAVRADVRPARRGVAVDNDPAKIRI